MSLIFIICTLLVHVLALPSIPHHPPSGLDITHQIAKRADSPKSARLKASLIPNTHFFVTTLNVNGKNVSMLIDTGSADFWLSGPKAPSAKGEPGAKLVPGEKFNITYGHSDAYVSGVAVSTTVKLGHLSVKDFTLGVATKNGYADKVTDGIMGLGFKNQNEMRPTQQPTLMMVVQQQLQQPVFTLNLKSDASGEIEFGLVDHSKHKGNLVEAKVNNITDPYWTIDAMTLSSGTAKVTQRMVFDSGSGDTMYADDDFVTAYWHQVTGSLNYNSWTYPCKSKKLPDLTVSIGGSGSATIPGDMFRGEEVDSGACLGLLQRGEVGPNRGIIAGPFFLAMFVVFDQSKPTIRFAAQA